MSHQTYSSIQDLTGSGEVSFEWYAPGVGTHNFVYQWSGGRFNLTSSTVFEVEDAREIENNYTVINGEDVLIRQHVKF